jgi:HK97 family phage prohead protease
MSKERRALVAAPELRLATNAKTAVGYAALFNSRTNIAGMFEEEIAPGAFSDSLRSSDIRALIDHDTGRVIGRTAAGTLALAEDTKGLRAEISLPDTTDGRDLAVQLQRGDISGMSIGFIVTKQEWDETGNIPLRRILQADLLEVSAVAFPAYEDTTLALRSLDEARKDLRRKNFHAADYRVRMKMNLDLKVRSTAQK